MELIGGVMRWDSGSYVVGFPWLPVLGQYLKQQRSVEGSEGLHGDVPPLASPTLEQLYATDSAHATTEGVPLNTWHGRWQLLCLALYRIVLGRSMTVTGCYRRAPCAGVHPLARTPYVLYMSQIQRFAH